jgi:hypothetical protein
VAWLGIGVTEVCVAASRIIVQVALEQDVQFGGVYGVVEILVGDLVYETLRAEAVGNIEGATVTPSTRHRWECFGLLGLFKDQELPTPIHESIRGVHLQGAAESAEGWRKTLDVYRNVIDKTLDDIFSRRQSDELSALPCGDLCESVFATTTETVDDPKPAYAVALSG